MREYWKLSHPQLPEMDAEPELLWIDQVVARNQALASQGSVWRWVPADQQEYTLGGVA